MSRLVILNHVRDGVELARQSKLNQRIIDFIEQHHGTSLIYYFYQKALEEGDIDSVQEQNYRYPGPKPQTRETALVMLADAVEGATRAIEDHTPTRISAVARKIVNNKFIDGQLDECPLTLRECELICESFTRTLSAMYHVRIKYPERKNAS
jgi:membrane-associated HD superfamily phosphohydrolase